MNKGKNSLAEIASVFFKMGCFAFGGPAAHIAMMQEEIIDKRKWMSQGHFLDLIGATNLIPGPNSTEMTMHCGHERGGLAGLFVAGICFIFPAVLITVFLAYLYVHYGNLPVVAPFIFGIKPAVLAVIMAAITKLGKKALKGFELGILGLLVFVVCLFGYNEILVLLLAGVLGATYFYIKQKANIVNTKYILPLFFLQSTASLLTQVPSLKIFWSFLKVGSILYGSGYVLFAYLDAELVASGWLSRLELIDAIAVGQFTPGPVLSTATFIGYQLGGFSGALAATLGIFIPSFVFVAIMNPLVPKMRSSKLLAFFLDSVNIAAVAVMLAVVIDMGRDALLDWKSILIAITALFFTFGPKKLSAIWIIILGSLMGYFLISFF